MKRICAFIFLLFSLSGSAQYLDDAQLWLNLDLEKKLSKKFYLKLSLSGRGTDNVTQFGRGAVDLGVVYKINKNIKVMADYLFVQKKRRSDSYNTLHRYNIALILKKDIGKWLFMYKNKFQSRYKNLNSSPDGHIAYYFDRSKFTIRHETTKRLTFYVAEEIFIPLNNPQIKGISRSRSFAGTLIKTTKKQHLELYFMYQQQIQNGDWYNQDDSYNFDPLKRNFVYGVGYTIEF